MVKSRAEIQREYRRRLRVDPVQYELYLLKARQRKHKNYVPVARLNRAEKAERIMQYTYIITDKRKEKGKLLKTNVP